MDSIPRGVRLGKVVMITTQERRRARGWRAGCDSDRVVVLVAGLARGGVGALGRLLVVVLLERPVVAGLASAGIAFCSDRT